MTKAEILAYINERAANTLQNTLGVTVTDTDGDCVVGEMPVDERTVQQFGYLHGGASAAFAETLASYGANLNVDFPTEYCVGVELSCSHLRPVKNGGRIFGRACPVRVGHSLQVWRIEIRDEVGEMICEARLTTKTIRDGAGHV